MVTAVAVQNTRGIQATLPMPVDVVDAQLHSIVNDVPPRAVKVGMLCNEEMVVSVAQRLRELPHIVLDCAFVSSRGERIADDTVVRAVGRELMSRCEVAIMKTSELEMLTALKIVGRDDAANAARQLLSHYGMKAIIVRNTYRIGDTVCDLFVSDADEHFMSLPDEAIRNTHGLAGTLSAAIASYLGRGSAYVEAIERAYEYLCSLTVYSAGSGLLGHHAGTPIVRNMAATTQQLIYNNFMSLVVNSCRKKHEVAYYAEQLNITSRYLATVTMSVAGRTPKELINTAITSEASRLLLTTSLSIQSIAYELGYSSQSQFSKLFHRIQGTTPTEFRKG